MIMYDKLIKDLRENHDKYFARDMEVADAIEDLEKAISIILTEYVKVNNKRLIAEAKLRESEVDNINLTGWLAEEHANQCPHYIRNVHDRGDDSMCKKYLCEVKNREDLKLKQSFWIPVTERMPQNDGKYLVAILCPKGKWVELNYFDGIDKWESADDCCIDTTKYVTHWMSLPQLPKDVVDDV